jgi:hypothetical protein
MPEQHIVAMGGGGFAYGNEWHASFRDNHESAGS